VKRSETIDCMTVHECFSRFSHRHDAWRISKLGHLSNSRRVSRVVLT
jgi:hypothetical protein